MTNRQQLLISVIIPAHNASAYLAEAVGSVRQQTYRPVEIIIVDDGSTDDTPQIMAGFDGDIRRIRQDNAGPSAARNAGLRLAKGEIIGFLDADDLWPADKLSTQMQYLLDNPHIQMVMGRIQFIEMPGAAQRDHRFDIEADAPINVHLGGALFRASIFAKIGTFDETMRYSEDVDLFMRIREHDIPVAILESVTLYYRLHQTNMTLDTATTESFLLRAFKKSLDRRRQTHGSAQDLPALNHFSQPPADAAEKGTDD